MARAAFPATTINLMLSDVVGDKMDVIASGPFVPVTDSARKSHSPPIHCASGETGR